MSDYEIDANDLRKELKHSSNIKCILSKDDWDKFLKVINPSNQQVIAAVPDDYGVQKYKKVATSPEDSRTEQEEIKLHLYVDKYNPKKKRNCFHTFTPPCQRNPLSAFCDRLKFKNNDHIRCEHNVKTRVDKTNKNKKCKSPHKHQPEPESCTCETISPLKKIKNCCLKFGKSDRICDAEKSSRKSILKNQCQDMYEIKRHKRDSVKFHEDGITGHKYSFSKYKLAEHKHPSKLSAHEIVRHKRESEVLHASDDNYGPHLLQNRMNRSVSISPADPSLRPRGPLVVHKVSPTSVKLIWGNPSQEGLLKIEEYIVEKNDIEKRKWEVVDTVPARGDLMELIVDGLVPGRKYLFSVAASTALGVTEPLVTQSPINVEEMEGDVLKMEGRSSRRATGVRTSRKESVVTPSPTSSPTDLSSDPLKINTLIALQNSPTSALLKWDKSAKPVKKYVVAKKSIGKKSWDVVGNVRGSIENPEFVVSDLKHGRAYSFRVDTEGVLPPLVTEKPFTLTDSKFLCPCNNGQDYCKCDGRESPDLPCGCDTAADEESNKKKLERKSTVVGQKSDGSKKLEEPSDKSPDTKSPIVIKITVSPTKTSPPASSKTMRISKSSPTRISDAKTPSTHTITTTTPEEFNEKRPAEPLEKSDPELMEDEKLKQKLSVRLNDSSKEKILDKEQLQESPFDGLYTAVREPSVHPDAASNSCMCQASDEGGEVEDPKNMPKSGENDEKERKLSKSQENELKRLCKEKIKKLIKKGDIKIKVINDEKHYYTKDGTLLLKKNRRLDHSNQPRGPLVINSVTPRSVHLSWNEPVKADLIPLKNYLVEKLEITENGKWIPAEEVLDVSESSDVTVSDLKPSTGYMFRVLAVNKFGFSEPLYTDDLVYTTSDLPNPPEGPLNVSSSKNEILLSWTKPKDADKKPVNKYIIDAQNPQSKTWHKVGEVHGNVDQPVIRLTQLQAQKEIYFRVFAQNIAGLSDPLLNSSVNTVEAKIKEKDPLKVLCNCKAEKDELVPVGPLKVYNKTATSLTISWKEPVPPFNNKVEKYFVEKLDLESGVWKLVGSKQSNENLELLIENLNPKSSYIFRVIACDGVRSSTPLFTKRPIVLSKGEETPDPNVVVVSDITSNQLKLSWNKFEQNENMVPFKHYAIEKMDISEGKWSSAGCSSPKEHFPEFIVTNLHPGCNYLFRVTTENCNLIIISEKVVQTDPGKRPPRASVAERRKSRKSERQIEPDPETKNLRESATQTQIDSGTQTRKESVRKSHLERSPSTTTEENTKPEKEKKTKPEKEKKTKPEKEKKTKPEKEKMTKPEKEKKTKPEKEKKTKPEKEKKTKPEKGKKTKPEKRKKTKPEKGKKAKLVKVAEKMAEDFISMDGSSPGCRTSPSTQNLNVMRVSDSELTSPEVSPERLPHRGSGMKTEAKKKKELNFMQVSDSELTSPEVSPERLPHRGPGMKTEAKKKKESDSSEPDYKPTEISKVRKTEPEKEKKTKPKKEKKPKPEKKRVSIESEMPTPVYGVWPPDKAQEMNVRVSDDNQGLNMYKRNTKSVYNIKRKNPSRTYTSYPLFVSHNPGLVHHEKNNKQRKFLSLIHDINPKPKKSIARRSQNVLEQIEKNHKNYRKRSSRISGLAKMHRSTGNNGHLKHRYSFKHYEFVDQKTNELKLIAENIDIKECAKLALTTDSEISSSDDDELMPQPSFHTVNQQQSANSEKSVIGLPVIILLPPNKKGSNRRQSVVIDGRMIKSTTDEQNFIELNPSAENRLIQSGYQTQMYPLLMDIPSMIQQRTTTKSSINNFMTKKPKTIASDILVSSSLCRHGNQSCIVCDLTEQIKMISENVNHKNSQDESLENIYTGSVDINEQKETDDLTQQIDNDTQMKQTIVQEMKIVWEECFKRSKNSIIETVIDELEQKR